jgi:predicted  nucleic acid-binding Zn-ribbon protein
VRTRNIDVAKSGPSLITSSSSSCLTEVKEVLEPDHVVESITGHLSRRMLEHYSHIRLNAKKAALDRLDGSICRASGD